MSDNYNLGVIIFAERVMRGVPGCHIWIQRTTTRRRSRGIATMKVRRRNNEA